MENDNKDGCGTYFCKFVIIVGIALILTQIITLACKKEKEIITVEIPTE